MTDAYDPSNIFAKIQRGEAPAVKIDEDDVSFAFLDIMPRGQGHTLVIPKTPARNLLDIPAQALAKFIPSVQRIALAASQALAADGVSVLQFNEAAGGQVVFHLHFHVIPRFAHVPLGPAGGPIVPASELEPIAAKIRAAL